MASVVVAEPHPAEPKLLEGPEGAIITGVVVEEALEHTIRGRVGIVTISWDIIIKYYKTKQWYLTIA